MSPDFMFCWPNGQTAIMDPKLLKSLVIKVSLIERNWPEKNGLP